MSGVRLFPALINTAQAASDAVVAASYTPPELAIGFGFLGAIGGAAATVAFNRLISGIAGYRTAGVVIGEEGELHRIDAPGAGLLKGRIVHESQRIPGANNPNPADNYRRDVDYTGRFQSTERLALLLQTLGIFTAHCALSPEAALAVDAGLVALAGVTPTAVAEVLRRQNHAAPHGPVSRRFYDESGMD